MEWDAHTHNRIYIPLNPDVFPPHLTLAFTYDSTVCNNPSWHENGSLLALMESLALPHFDVLLDIQVVLKETSGELPPFLSSYPRTLLSSCIPE